MCIFNSIIIIKLNNIIKADLPRGSVGPLLYLKVYNGTADLDPSARHFNIAELRIRGLALLECIP